MMFVIFNVKTEPIEWTEITAEGLETIISKIEEACKSTVNASPKGGMQAFDSGW